MNHRMHIPAPYVHPIYTDNQIDTPVGTNAPFPVIVRDTRLVAVNNSAPFTPTLATSNSPGHTDMFGSTNALRANIGIAVGSNTPDIVVPDAWRIRRFIVVCNRSASGTTGVAITCVVYGRLVAPDGTPTPSWRSIASVSDGAFSNDAPMRFVIPTSLAGVFGYDQYRIVFRRDPDSTPAPELSLIRVYAEFG
jgi:hypothetical protein